MAAAGSKRYSDELKRDAVDMVEQLVAQGSTEWAAIGKTADLLGVGSAETVRQWVRKAPSGGVSAPAKADSEEIRRLTQYTAIVGSSNLSGQCLVSGPACR